MGSFRDLFTVSDSGIVVFRAGSAERRLTWVDRHGDVVRSVGSPGVILNLSLCPGDHQAGFTVRSLETGVDSVWIADFDRDVTTPFVESAYSPTWDPDGGSLFYGFRGTPYEVRRKWLRAGQKEESIGVIDTFATPHSISPDGRYVLFTRTGNNFDVGVKDLQGNGKPLMLLSSPFSELQPHFSPDGRWFVYSSDELGQSEIFVRRFPMTEEKWRISTAGGQQPSWRGDGKEIFFLALDDKLMAATVSAGSQFSSGAPQPLFSSGLTLEAVGNQYAASADGQRFLMAVPTQGLDSSLFRVLLNWRAAK
jgi:hypothetical protein